MALFRLEARVISREKRGRSVIAAAAYRTGTKLKDERNDKIFDYRRREQGVMDSVIVAPEGAPAWALDTQSLWNMVEAGEKRADAQLAREFILSLPRELPIESQFETAVNWARKELVSKGMIAEVSLHHTKRDNPHVHILCPMRKLDGDKFSSKKPREWNDVNLLRQQRESWASAVNAALEKAGRTERVDHRSLKDRGIDKIPEPKLGPEATAMKRRGVEADPRNFQRLREVKLLNEMRPIANAIRKGGEIIQRGLGASWWERSANVIARVRSLAVDAAKTGWRALLGSDRGKGPSNSPEVTR